MSGTAGILLERTLDDRSPSRRFDAAVIAREIEELERAVHPIKLVTAVRQEGPLTRIVVLAASPLRRGAGGARAAGNAVSSWRREGW